MRALVVAGAVAVATLLCAGAGRGDSGVPAPREANLPQIPSIASTGGVATLTLRAALDRSGRPAFFWDGREVAPTIRVRPGDEIRLRYENDLPEVCGLDLVSDSNLHFHGLTVAPTVHSDDVVATTVAPGKTFDYVVKIGRDQPPGLYWYHPHPHGLANWEIGNGMAGVIVVEGIADALPSVAGLREQVLVLRDPPVDPSVAAAERQSARGPADPFPPPDDDGGPVCGVETTGTPTINGLPSATIGIRPGERELWRILNASGHRHFDLALTAGTMQLVAVDGIPLGYAAGHAPSERVTHVVIPPAGRAEVVVTGTARIQYLYSRCFDAGSAGDVDPQIILAQLLDDGGTSPAPRVLAPYGLAKGAAFRGALPRPAVRRTIGFEEDARGFYLDKRAYDPRLPPVITARAGTMEEWTLVNETDEVHAFHIHQTHFVVEATDGTAERDPHWEDVVDVPPRRRDAHGRLVPSTVRVLIDFRDPVIRGVFLFHCHIVDHEDGGMMAKIRVI